MPLKKSKGNMYDWVTHMHSHLAGECPHKCSYCYVQKNRFGVSERYKGNLKLIESELNVNYKSGNIIFIEHMNDMFADDVSTEFKCFILNHCREYQNNQYIFQSKNPWNALAYLYMFPKNYFFGTTIETNRDTASISNAPAPSQRYYGMNCIKCIGVKKLFITVEPIMNFDVDILAEWIIDIRPEFVNIGADSKNCNLPEPPKEKVIELINILKANNINIKKKSNLDRLLKED